MSDLQQHIQERKSWDPEFAAGFDSGYALYKKIFLAKMAGQAITLEVVFERTPNGYLGFLKDSPPINAHGVSLAEVRAKLAQEVMDMLDPEWVQVEGNFAELNGMSDSPARLLEVFVILTSSVGRGSKCGAVANQQGRKKAVLAAVG
jgi:hypothetical protein